MLRCKMAVHIHTNDQWKKVFDELDPSVPIVVKFSADWCGPCKALTPRFDELALKYQGKAAFLGVDIEELAEVSEQLEISSLPTMIVFYNSKEEKRTVGAGSSVIGEIENFLNTVL